MSRQSRDFSRVVCRLRAAVGRVPVPGEAARRYRRASRIAAARSSGAGRAGAVHALGFGDHPPRLPHRAAPLPEKSGTPAIKALPAQSRVFFRYTGVDSHYGKVAWTDSAHARQAHFVESLNCEVVYVAGGRGICLTADRGVFTTYSASLFDARTFDVSSTFPLKGIPSRARVSIDGSLAAFTVFVSGHGYTTLDFSTQSLLVDTRTGAALADLEDFEVRRDGAVIKEADFNFWGVTFTPDAKQFFATLSTAGKHLLVRGDIDARRMEVIHENVECPSLSPDARHVAYKKRLMDGNRIVWQLQVLELASGREMRILRAAQHRRPARVAGRSARAVLGSERGRRLQPQHQCLDRAHRRVQRAAAVPEERVFARGGALQGPGRLCGARVVRSQ